MNKWKLAFWISAVVLVVVVGNGLYTSRRILEVSNKIRLQEVMLGAYEHATDGLVDVIIKGAGKYSKAEILAVLEEATPEREIRSDDSTIHYGPVVFRFEQDSLVSVYHRRF